MTTSPDDAELPVAAALPTLLDALGTAGAAVLVAPPGSGKTTLVPPALAAVLPGRIVVAEPRRIAARAAARRIAHLSGGRVGDVVGYTVRGESRTGPATRIEVVTTGVLVQRLQRDPELPGTAAVVLDECHERHLETDLALAFAVDARAALRPDLALLAMSATAQADRIAAALGGDGGPVPVVTAPGAVHDVRDVWCPQPPGIAPPHGLRVDPRQLDHVADVVRRAVAETGPDGGDILVFLPGAGEIEAVARRLSGLGAQSPVDVVPLHGRLSGSAQDAALAERPGRRRVVLATAGAESSLTVPGVRGVVDAGLARVPRIDLARGLGSLVTVQASRAAAVQRAGRAGRLGPGAAYRCWAEADDARRPAHPEPAVATADLTAFALELARWGSPDGAGLALLDPPPAAAMQVARAALHDLGAVDDDGRLTERGRGLAAIGAHPRLARALLVGAATVGPRRAAEIVALLADDAGGSGGSGGDDLTAVWRSVRHGTDRAASGRWRDETARLQRSVPSRSAGSTMPGRSRAGPTMPDDLAAAVVVGLAFPERLARRRRPDGTSYLMASGTAAELADGSSLRGSPWLAVAVADRPPGRRDARIRLAVPLDEATAREVGAPLARTDEEVVWRDGDVRARRVVRLGAIELSSTALDRPAPALVAAAVAEGLRTEGTALLRWTPAAVALRARLAACWSGLGDPWPAVDDDALLAALDVSRARNRADLRRLDLVTALRGLVPWELSARLDDVAPVRIRIPAGARPVVDYSEPESPTVEVAVQEAFGWTTTPAVTGRPLRVRLLSPARRPVAVTTDLASFWRTGYPAVRAELRGRYPRHPWPADPLAPLAPPTRPTSR